MKIIVLSDVARSLFSKSQLERLRGAGDLSLVESKQPLADVSEIFAGEGERILAVDPDFCHWTLPLEVMEKVPNLRAVVLQTTGFSYVDVEWFAKRNIPVVNLRGFSSVAVAEWAITAALNLARKMPVLMKKDWALDFNTDRGFELRGKTAGIIGLGNIGKRITENCKGLGMNVTYWSKQTRDARFTFAELPDLMAQSDAVFLSLAPNDETKSLISDVFITRMKKSAIFIRTGSAFNHELLLEQVKTGNLFGYAFEEEKKFDFNAFEGNIWVTSTNGWLTNESISRNAEQWGEAIVRAAKGEYPNRGN